MIKKRTKILFVFLSVLTLCYVIYQLTTSCQSYTNFTKSTLLIKKHILRAIRYNRNNIVKQELLKALYFVSTDIELEQSQIYSRKTRQVLNGEKLDVCLEEFQGVIDHPLYNLGQIEVKCNKKPFEQVLTFIIIVDNCQEMSAILKGIRDNYNKSKVIIASSFEKECSQSLLKNVKFIKNISDGYDILKILKLVDTEYVLFASNIYHFDNQSHIERLVQMVSYTDTKIAAGGVRLEDGRFSIGCYQMAMKMYTIKLVEGYDMSFNSCVYCDYSSAPFVTRNSYFIDQLQIQNKSLTNVFLLEFYTDLMISNSNQILVCPDVLFHTKPFSFSDIEKPSWLHFVAKFELNRIILPGGQDINFTCSEAAMSCYKKRGLMVPLCCLKELSDSLKFMNKLLLKQNVTFEVLEGTVMGSLKYNNILLWERDADSNFRVHMIDKLEAKLDEIQKNGYSMVLTYECPYKRDHEKCRHAGWHGSIYYAFKTDNWRTEMYGVTYILSDFRGKLKNPTKIYIDGEWYITYTNPVLYARNIYGGDVFQHIEHHSVIESSPAVYTKSHSDNFGECPRPGFHGCLDNFLRQGNLQFLDIYIFNFD